MAAYYNEFDGKKATWLRELILRGLIAPGEVDERSIVDVQSDDLRGFSQCHFFAGIGIWSHALRLAGWPDDREVWTGSCPCQPFSAAGKGEAFDDERHLWPEFFRLIEARRPIVCFGEQVASIDGLAWLDTVQSDLDDADYTCGAVDICAAGFGAPHRRQRLYWVAHTTSPRRTGAGQYDGGLPLLSARSEQRGEDGSVADTSVQRRQSQPGITRVCGAMATERGERFPVSSDGDIGGVGDTRSAGLQVGRCQPGDAGQECATAIRDGDAGGVENPLRPERRSDLGKLGGHWETSGRDESANRIGERSEVERVDDSHGIRAERTANGEPITSVGREVDELADTLHRGRPGRRVDDDSGAQNARGDAPERSEYRRSTETRSSDVPPRGPVNGFWESCDWVLTRPQRVGDRPGLRPVECQPQSMVDGIAEGMGRGGHSGFPLAEKAEARVSRLWGYGDGIVVPVAEAFIKAYLEIRNGV